MACWSRAGDPTALGEALHELGSEPERRAEMGGRRPRARRALRVAAGRRRARLALRGRGRVPEPSSAVQRAAVRTGVRSADLGPRAPARRVPSLEAARSGRRPPQGVPRCPQGGRRGLRRARRRPDRARARPHRAQADRERAARRDAGLGARRVRSDVRVDADPRRGVARRPARGASEHARPPPRRGARNHDRSADVGHPARAARRAIARADRRAAARARARAAAGGARDARRPDVPEPRSRS